MNTETPTTDSLTNDPANESAKGDEGFVREEKVRKASENFSLLWRYISAVPLMKVLLVPNLLSAIVIYLGYQLFMWLAGEYAGCPQEGPCVAHGEFLVSEVPITLGGLTLLAVGVLLLRGISWSIFECGAQVATMPLLNRMIEGVSRVRTTFFDEYPSGKIINRINRDADQLRNLGPSRIGDSIAALVELAVTALLIGYANPLAGLVAVPTLLFFIYVQRNVAPMLQRVMVLRSIRFGEVLHRETDVIEGVRIFVVYGHLRALLSRLGDSVYRYMQMHFVRGQIEAWGRFWCEVAVALFGALTLLAVYSAVHSGRVSMVLGMVIVSASFRLGSIFAWLTWSLGLLYELAGYAGRVFEYVDLPHEESEEMREEQPARRDREQGTRTPLGDISFLNYSMSYRPSTPIILENLSLTIQEGSKVGLIGRTGSGKSSIVQALFRMVYVQSGDIAIGSTSLFSLPVREARALFAVVPQDPYLFEGTVRSNLDRSGEFSDDVLQRALETVQLRVTLDTSIAEGGGNLSQGERQLLCLARCTLTSKPYVIMDEPTSGVDVITDAIIQRVLQTALGDKTVITIAHRLETLSGVDRIIELRNGQVVRDGPPEEILPQLRVERTYDEAKKE